MSVWVTGDIHGEIKRFYRNNFWEQDNMNKEFDYVIILGDFGLVWNIDEESELEKFNLDALENKNFTTLFLDGNHENFTRLNLYPKKKWNGGWVHEIRPHVLHLMRGEVYTIENKKFFAFGGAASHDISDGIIDINDDDWLTQVYALEEQGKTMYRIKDISWWEEELPSKDEMKNGISNLKKNNWNVDYIITHSPSASIIDILGSGTYEQDVLTEYLESIKSKLQYKKHFMGHMHLDAKINNKDILLYNGILRIL